MHKKSFGKKPRGNYQRGGPRRPHMVFLNEQIKAPTIIIVDDEWEKLGSFPRRRALELADEKGLDLVQMHYDSQKMVSTVKMVDYGKYIYQKQKDEKEKKRNQKMKWLKELKLSYMIGDNDLALKIRKASELLQEWYNVKMSIRLRWRERIYKHNAKEKLVNVIEQLVDVGRPQFTTPKQEAQWYSITLFTKIK